MAALAWFGFKQTCYRNSHSLSELSHHIYLILLFSMETSLDKEQLECLNLLHVVGRGRRVLGYGCHGHHRRHRGGRLHHQVGSAGHRVWLRGHRHVLVMGRQHAHAIGHLGSDWSSSEGQKQKPTPICCMDGRRAHCCCMSIPCIFPCVIGPTWIGLRKVILYD